MDIDAQARFAVATIPGTEEAQMRLLFQEAFSRNSTVVVGGSRVRASFGQGAFRTDSDLDVGFDNLSPRQVTRVLQRVSSAGPLGLDPTRIIPGSRTRTIPVIQSPEEFFQRSGMRASTGSQPGQPFIPSGSYTFHPDGSITVYPPAGTPQVLAAGTY